MLSESGTLGDYGNPKLITAGLVQQEIRDIWDTDTSQQHQAVQGCLCVLGREGSTLGLHGRGQIVTLSLSSWLGRKEIRMNKGRWKARKLSLGTGL